jgi:hypothetical protein
MENRLSGRSPARLLLPSILPSRAATALRPEIRKSSDRIIITITAAFSTWSFPPLTLSLSHISSPLLQNPRTMASTIHPLITFKAGKCEGEVGSIAPNLCHVLANNLADSY